MSQESPAPSSTSCCHLVKRVRVRTRGEREKMPTRPPTRGLGADKASKEEEEGTCL